MGKIINLTPDNFVDAFILCLSWQWNAKDGLTHTWTTVDKVFRILKGLGVVTEHQTLYLVQDVRVGVPYQRRLLRSCTILYRNSFEAGEMAHVVLRADSKLVIVTQDVSRGPKFLAHLVRDQRIYLTLKGLKYAKTLEERFAESLTRDAYLAEDVRQAEHFASSAAHTAASIQYRKRTSHAIDEEQ